jgi:hypothetical protein
MKIIEAPSVYRSLPILHSKIIFLAGSIEMGAAENWQQEIIDVIKESNLNNGSTIILNPRRKDWDSSWEQNISNVNFKEQVEWELCGLKDSDMVIFYFDPTTKSPISLMELGMITTRKKKTVLVCCPDGFWKKGNVEILCEWYTLPLYHTKEDLIEDLKVIEWK